MLDKTTIRMFGSLHTHRTSRGLKPVAEVLIPPEGRIAEDIAVELGLPLEKIEGVFVNHVVHGIDHVIHPGDKVAFISTGVPGPHRYTLGIYSAGKR